MISESAGSEGLMEIIMIIKDAEHESGLSFQMTAADRGGPRHRRGRVSIGPPPPPSHRAVPPIPSPKGIPHDHEQDADVPPLPYLYPDLTIRRRTLSE